ncbi:octopamine receptor 1-like [Actinia tenebrosa]|uniref:Octopamine receptor 1-like n=1 Tax=Actinia tenebrosa TaxID=6105 RepID=A0A6P8IFY1_ACTTE|nr:octopamine receptor 1-like [Actinia tenebrosa]
MALSVRLALELANRSSLNICFESIVIGVIIFFTVVGNTFVCCAVWRNQRLRTISNMFVVALAISDSLMGILCMPFVFGTLIEGRWLFGDAFCRVHGFTGFTLALVSIHTMSLIAVNRFYCIVKPSKYQNLFRSSRTRIYILIVWLFAFVGSVPPFLLDDGGYSFHPGKGMCLYTFESNLVYTIFIEVAYIGCPLLLISFCYSSVFKEVYRTNKVFVPNQMAVDQLRVNVQETKITKTLAIVFLGFSICWLPASIIDTLGAFYGQPRFKREVYLTYTFMAYLSSLINPIIYGITSRGFRREYKAMLKGLTCHVLWKRNNFHHGQSTTFQESQMEAWQQSRPVEVQG